VKTVRYGGQDMRRQGRWLWLGLLIFAMHANASDSNLSLVMEMGDAPGRVDQRKVDESIRWAVKELYLEGQPLPLIVVFHISPAVAVRLGIEGTSLWHNGGDSKRYELWIVGEPTNEIYGQMAVSILDRHFALKLDDATRTRAIQTVCSRVDSTVSAKSLTPRARSWK
jgi:hypothetical protein